MRKADFEVLLAELVLYEKKAVLQEKAGSGENCLCKLRSDELYKRAEQGVGKKWLDLAGAISSMSVGSAPKEKFRLSENHHGVYACAPVGELVNVLEVLVEKKFIVLE